jgi:preprotein translocase subunit SecD
MKKFFQIAGAGFALALAGCGTLRSPARDYTPTLARFFLETTDAGASTVVLPVSGVRVAIGDKPVFAENDIVDVDVAKVELGQCLLFHLTPSAARDLYRFSGSNQGRRLVLVLNNVPIGARRIDSPINDGAVFVFAEVSDAELAVLAVNLKKTSVELQRAIARKR